MGFLQKCKYSSQVLFPKFWKRRYSKRSMENTNMNGVYIEWWDYRTNLGDYLAVVVAEHMLRQKFGTVTVQKKPAGGGY